MAGQIQFKIIVSIRGEDGLEEMKARAEDFRPAFDAIVTEWAALNAQKFDKGAGMGVSGAQVDESVYWQALTDEYWQRKMRAGFPDDLMVRTGSLRAALTDPEGFFHEATATQVAFGTPMSPEDEVKVAGNWGRRQAVFLGLPDQNAVRRIIGQYLELGPDFAQIRFAKGLAAVQQRSEGKAMDMDFSSEMQED